MKIEDKVIKSVVSNVVDTHVLKKNDTVIVALSGGADSMCLFDVMHKLSLVYDFNIMAIHVHHGIRGYEADEDLHFVESYCKSFSVKVIKAYVDAVSYAKKNGFTLEEAARKLRYDEFHKAWVNATKKKKSGDVYVAVAHHMKDQIETIVHNMLRGTGLKGIAAMQKTNRYILRPLLNVAKVDIDDYVYKYDIPFVIDATNNDENYTRNFIRNEILDKFLKVNDKAYEHIARLSEQAREAIDYIETTSKYILKEICKSEDLKGKEKCIVLDVSLFNNVSHIIKIGIIREVIIKLVSTLKDVTNVNLDDVVNMSKKDKGGHLDLPYNITVDKKKGDLIFTLNEKNLSMSKRKKR